MKVYPELNQIMRAGKYAVNPRKQNEAGLWLSVKLLLAAIASLCALSCSNHYRPHFGQASWYMASQGLKKDITAYGEVFNDSHLTAASWDYPLNTRVKVTNVANGKSIVVRINDKGPAKRLYANGRIIDLSRVAFYKIASLEQGVIKVKVERIGEV